MVWPTIRSRTATEQNKTDIPIQTYNSVPFDILYVLFPSPVWFISQSTHASRSRPSEHLR